METKEIKKAVVEQIIGMLENNILRECGVEMFEGWLEDGDVFFNLGWDEKDIAEAMRYAHEVSPALDVINNVLGDLSYE